MIQARQDTAQLEHRRHFACVVGPENEHSVRKEKKKITVALRVHVLMVKLLSLLQVLPLLQNNGVTFDPIFVDRRCEISMLFYRPGKFAASFCGFGGIISEYVSLHFLAFAVDVERDCRKLVLPWNWIHNKFNELRESLQKQMIILSNNECTHY